MTANNRDLKIGRAKINYLDGGSDDIDIVAKRIGGWNGDLFRIKGLGGKYQLMNWDGSDGETFLFEFDQVE